MDLVIFGPPGSGKGTYASRLKSDLEVPVVSMGDIFRDMAKERTRLGEEIKMHMQAGKLVPDDITVPVLTKRLCKNDCAKGFILDGYPRTLDQAKRLDEFRRIKAVIHLLVPEWIIVERLSSRRICRECREVYNIRFLKPKKAGICDKCGGQLYQRNDDTEEVIRERLEVYRKQTRPILEFYRGKTPFVEFKCEDIDTPPEVAVSDILRGLKKLRIF